MLIRFLRAVLLYLNYSNLLLIFELAEASVVKFVNLMNIIIVSLFDQSSENFYELRHDELYLEVMDLEYQ